MRGGIACAGRPVGSGRTRGGCIIIEEPRQLAELTADANMTLIRSQLPPVSDSRHSPEFQRAALKSAVTSSTGFESRDTRSTDCYWQSHALARCYTTLGGRQSQSSGWLGPRACRELQEKSEPEYRCTKQMYEDLLHIDKHQTDSINQYMMDTALLDLRRKEMLHRKWTNNVYDPISFKISAALNPTSQQGRCRGDARSVSCDLSRDGRPESAACRVQAYNDFLDCLNRKGTVFLDVCDPCEYCPLPPNTCVTTGPLNDPLLVQGRTELEEDAIALGCITGSTHSRKDIEQLRLFPAVHPCGREGTSWKQYLEMPLCDIDSPVRMASRNRMYGSRNHSAVPWYEPPASTETSGYYTGIRRLNSTRVVS